jgi:hypothetical protein
MIVNYDLSQQLCSSDFYGWMIEWTAKGATEIVFDTREFRPGWPNGVARRRFETMIAPAPAFLGIASREGIDGERVGLRAKNQTLVRFVRDNRIFPRMRSVLPPKSERNYYTVTLREAEQDRWRNSNKSAWLQFAADIQAIVIDDYIVKPYHLWELMAIYAGAKMNFGVLSGPMQLCSLSQYPCMIFNLGKHRHLLERSNMRQGDPLPWCGNNQFAFWDDDIYENLQQRFRMIA